MSPVGSRLSTSLACSFVASPEYAALKSRIEHLRSCFIISHTNYWDYTAEDQTKKLAFQVLSSAAIEGYVEDHCLKVAKAGIDRLKHGAPTSSGRALVAWSLTRGSREYIPIHDDHFLVIEPNRMDLALESYLKSVKATHGISARDLGGLINPLGVQIGQVPAGLADKLQELSEKRDPAVHATVRTQTEPSAEFEKVRDILDLLDQLETGLNIALTMYPC
jgi:hypothetical protein